MLVYGNVIMQDPQKYEFLDSGMREIMDV